MNIEQNPSRSVPNDDIAKLSFYLENIGSCIPGAIDAAYIQYKLFGSFSQETKEAIVKICEIMEPSILENNAIKQVNKCDIEATGSDCETAFIPLTERINLSIVNNSEQVAGLNLVNRQVIKIMIYTENWLQKYYITPLQKMKQKFARIQEPPRRNVAPPPSLPTNHQDQYVLLNPNESELSHNPPPPKNRKSQEYSSLNYIGIFFLIAVFSVLGLFYTLFFLRKNVPTKKLLCWICVPALLVNALAIYELVQFGFIDFGGLVGKVASMLHR